MSKELSKEEQVDKPSEKEEVVESSEEEKADKPPEFGNVRQAIAAYEEKALKKSSEDAEKKPEEKTLPEEKSAEEKKKPEEETKTKEPSEKSKLSLRLVNDKGEEVAFPLKVEGEDVDVSDLNKLQELAQKGYHYSQDREKFKEDLDLAKQLKPLLPEILAFEKANKEGRLRIDGKLVGKDQKKEGEEEEEEDITKELDPELTETKNRVKTLEEKIQEKDKQEVEKTIEDTKTFLDGEIEKHRKTYFAAIIEPEKEMPKGVWGNLGLRIEDEENPGQKKPKFTPEEAIKRSHESMIAHVKKLVKEHPEEFIDEKEIATKFLAKKEEREEAPVGSPSELPAGEAGDKKPKEFKNLKEAVAAGFEQLEKKAEAAEKS